MRTLAAPVRSGQGAGMTTTLGQHRSTMLGRTTVLVIITFLATLVPGLAGQADAATPITASQAISNQSGSATVRGYVVGQPTATATVITPGYPNAHAIAIADSAAETSPSRILVVQLRPEACREGKESVSTSDAWGSPVNYK